MSIPTVNKNMTLRQGLAWMLGNAAMLVKEQSTLSIMAGEGPDEFIERLLEASDSFVQGLYNNGYKIVPLEEGDEYPTQA